MESLAWGTLGKGEGHVEDILKGAREVGSVDRREAIAMP